MTRTSGFDADAPGLPRGLFGCSGQRLSHASPTVCGLDDERDGPTPGRDLVSDRNEEDGYEPEDSVPFSCDEFVRAGIGKKRAEPA